MKISVSWLSILEDLNSLESKIKLIDELSFNYIHLDIADGIFVPTKTREYEEIETIICACKTKLDIHLMVDDVKAYIDKYSKLNPEFISFHLEARPDPVEIINYIKSKNIKVGLAINIDTPVNELIPYLNLIDIVLVMSVKSGYGGTEFNNIAVSKLEELVSLKQKYNFIIELDGGIKIGNLELCKDADILVIGSAITLSDNYSYAKKMIEKRIYEIMK